MTDPSEPPPLTVVPPGEGMAGSLGAIGALLSIGGTYPWWSLAVFFLCLYVVHGLVIFGEEERTSSGRT